MAQDKTIKLLEEIRDILKDNKGQYDKYLKTQEQLQKKYLIKILVLLIVFLLLGFLLIGFLPTPTL